MASLSICSCDSACDERETLMHLKWDAEFTQGVLFIHAHVFPSLSSPDFDQPVLDQNTPFGPVFVGWSWREGSSMVLKGLLYVPTLSCMHCGQLGQ